MIEFKIRAYGRMELAQLYSPELTGIAAYRKMNKWIVRCPGLQERLLDLGAAPFLHSAGGKGDSGCVGRTLAKAMLYDF